MGWGVWEEDRDKRGVLGIESSVGEFWERKCIFMFRKYRNFVRGLGLLIFVF